MCYNRNQATAHCWCCSLLSRVWLFRNPRTAACQASLSFTISWSLLRLTSIESMTPSYHLSLCCPLCPLPSIFLSIRVFSNESSLCIRWPKYWSFSFSNSPSNEYPGLTSFIDWFHLLAVQGGHNRGRRAGAGAESRWECMLESSWQVNWSAGCLCSGPGSE